MVTKTISVKNPTGLHARPAGLLTKKAMGFQSKIHLHVAEKVLDAKSILSIMSGGIKFGDDVFVVCEGEDQEAALLAISDFIVNLEE